MKNNTLAANKAALGLKKRNTAQEPILVPHFRNTALLDEMELEDSASEGSPKGGEQLSSGSPSEEEKD